MKKMNAMALFVFLFLWSCLVAPDSEAVDQPVLQENDRWEFKGSTTSAFANSNTVPNGDYEVVYRGGQLEVFQLSGGEKIPIGGDLLDELKRMIRPDDREYLKFPLAVGNKWTATHSQTSPGAQFKSARSMEYAVLGANDGRFEIKGSGTATTRGPSMPQIRTYTYSPRDKAIVKYFYDSAVGEKFAKFDIELVKFTPGAK